LPPARAFAPGRRGEAARIARGKLLHRHFREQTGAAANVVGVERKPLDLAFLDQFVRMLDGRGPVWDIGCGPWDVMRHLQDRGLDVCGIDLSPALIAEARIPVSPFLVGELANLDAAAGSLAEIAALYSLIHLPPHQMQSVLNDFGRYLQRDGLLLILHAGEGVIEVKEWFGKPLSLHGYFFQSVQIMNRLLQVGFVVISSLSRPPYPEIEFPSRRVYPLAQSSA
jgi:hypothetical protein